jgi:hypothetical protein
MRRAILFTIGAFFAVSGSEAGALTGQEIAAKTYEVLQAQVDSYKDYTVFITQVTKDKEGEEMARVKCKLYFKKPDKEHVDVLEFYKGGEKEDPPKRRDDEDGRLKFKLPFEKEYFRDYRFTYKDTETVSGEKCWRVAFNSTKEVEGYIYGSIWIAANGYRLVKGTGQPYVQPPHCSKSSMTMYFREYDGRTMVSRVSMYARATFLLFINKDIYVTSTYSGYKFNQGVPDSKFQ